jgi:hypothetical protein
MLYILLLGERASAHGEVSRTTAIECLCSGCKRQYPAARERITTASTRSKLIGRGRGTASTRGRNQVKKRPKQANPIGRGTASTRGKKRRSEGSAIPDLNEQVHDPSIEEVPVSQNAPPNDDIWF